MIGYNEPLQKQHDIVCFGRVIFYMYVIRHDVIIEILDFFLSTTYSYESSFIQGLLKKNKKKLARSFNFTFR